MSETYTAAQKTVASRPRSQRLRDTAGSSSASASAASAVVGDQYWAMETQDDGTSALKTDNLIKVLEGIRIVKDGHEIVLSIDENGNLFINGNVGVYGDVAAYAAIAAQYETIKGYVNEYLAGRGVTPGGGGGTINTIEVTGTGNVMTGVTLSEDLTKLTFTLGLKVYDWALQATKPVCSFSELTGKPTTLAGYGITDAAKGSETVSYKGYIAENADLDTYTTNGIYIAIGYSQSGSTWPSGAHTYGFLEVIQGFSTNDVLQRYTPYGAGSTRFSYQRQKFAGSGWTSWESVGTTSTYDLRYLGKNAKAQSAVTADSATTATSATSASTSSSCSGNSATATKLATARTLWGQNFDGSASVAGTLTGEFFVLYDSEGNPYLKLVNRYGGTTYTYYCQAYNGVMALGAGFAKSLKIYNDGKVTAPSSITATSITLKSPDGTKTRTISVDNSGNLCVDGTIAASGDVVAYK